MRVKGFSKIFDAQTMLTTVNSSVIDMQHGYGFNAVAEWTVSTPSNKTFEDADVDTTTDVITIASHGFTTGVKTRLTTDGVLPTGLAAATDYWIIVLTANTFALAASYANALAGTKVDITAAAGGGTHTVAIVALAGATIKLQQTVDNVNDPTVTPTWIDVSSSSQNITATGSYAWNAADMMAPFYRLQATLTAGLVTLNAKSYTKGA